MGSIAPRDPTLPAYTAARERIAHRSRPSGILDVTGEDRVAFLQGQLTQEMRGLAAGEARPVAGLTPKGKLLFVARAVGLPDRIRLLVPAVIRPFVLDHLRKYAVFSKVSVEDRSDEFFRIGLYGPQGAHLALPDWIERLPAEGEFSAELLAPVARRDELEALLESAGSSGTPEETAEVLRVEAGRPRFGQDMDSANLPDEAGLHGAISTTKGCYVGQEVVARMRTYGRINRRLVSFRFPEGAIGSGEVLRPDEETPSRIEAGRVTSSVESPLLGAIGLGYAFRDVPSGGRLVSVAEPRLGAIVSDLPSG
jgi:aminomethyltransferase